MMERIDLTEDGNSYIKYWREIDNSLKIDDFEELWNLHPKEYGKIKMFGKLIETPRWQEAFINDYYFSGIKHKGKELPKCLNRIFKGMKKLEPSLNGVLINWYLPEHYIGFHSDDESKLDSSVGIYCLTYLDGKSRRFVLENKDTKKKYDIKLENNSLIMMGGTTQKTHKHSIPKLRKKDGECGRRVSITFRCFKDN